MPLYKRVGNRILTRFENVALHTDLTEFHSGYRAYRTDILRRIPFEANTDGFDFDTIPMAAFLSPSRNFDLPGGVGSNPKRRSRWLTW